MASSELLFHVPSIRSSFLLQSSFSLTPWPDKTKWKISQCGVWPLGTACRLWMDGALAPGLLPHLPAIRSADGFSQQVPWTRNTASSLQGCVLHDGRGWAGQRWTQFTRTAVRTQPRSCVMQWCTPRSKPTPSEESQPLSGWPLWAGLCGWSLGAGLWILNNTNTSCTKGPLWPPAPEPFGPE